MKVHLVSAPSSPGVNRIVAELTERLAKRIDVRTTFIQQKERTIFGKKIGGILSLWLQRHKVTRRNGEILHALTPLPFSAENYDLMTQYDIFGFQYLHLWLGNVHGLVTKWMEYQSVKTVPKLLVLVNAVKRDLVTYCGRREEDIFVVPPGVDMEKFRIRTDVEPLDNTVLYAGDAHPRKNLERLIIALSKIDPSPTLLWVGGKVFWPKLREDLRGLAVSLRVPLYETGYISDEELVEYYNRVTVLVHAPLVYDGFGLAPVEAMACGLLPAVSNVKPFDETLGPVAITFDPEDTEDMARSIEFALEHPAKSLRQKQILRNEVKRFDWDNIVEQILEVYRRIDVKS